MIKKKVVKIYVYFKPSNMTILLLIFNYREYIHKFVK